MHWLPDPWYSLVESFARYLPADLKATFSIFDQPQVYLSWARRGSLVELGLKNRRQSCLIEPYVTHDPYFCRYDPFARDGQRRSPTDSKLPTHFRVPIRERLFDVRSVRYSLCYCEGADIMSGHSFIYDPLEASDLCDRECGRMVALTFAQTYSRSIPRT